MRTQQHNSLIRFPIKLTTNPDPNTRKRVQSSDLAGYLTLLNQSKTCCDPASTLLKPACLVSSQSVEKLSKKTTKKNPFILRIGHAGRICFLLVLFNYKSADKECIWTILPELLQREEKRLQDGLKQRHESSSVSLRLEALS